MFSPSARFCRLFGCCFTSRAQTDFQNKKMRCDDDGEFTSQKIIPFRGQKKKRKNLLFVQNQGKAI
jgi:hypothetical protein